MRSGFPRGVLLTFVVAALLVAIPAVAQNPTGTLTGRVTGPDGAGLPGVTVTATSPNLQGARVTVTSGNGDYKLAFMPPGDYDVSYELDGFATITREVKISAASTTPSDIRMQLATVAEEIVVTGQQAAISETGTGSATYTQDEVEKLPVSRSLESVIELSPGVSNNGVSGTPSIAGAMSFENLWLINGVVINENIRGQVLDLFIEDAIQETTTAVSGVSAEYGRFTGGVVNAITKSGGNEFDGSLRVSMTNDDWSARTPLSPDRQDDIQETYEATLGGYFWKDHVWFFGAGRDFETATNRTTDLTNISYPFGQEEQRLEGKLTVTPHPSHTLIGSYLEIDEVTQNSDFGTILDVRSLNPNREDPQEISSVNYTGILTANFFVEAQYSERDFTIGKGSGGPAGDIINGTVMRVRGEGWRHWSPTFCGNCEDQVRNNENTLVKGSYFLSTDTAGTHDLVFGYDTFSDIIFSINHQTGSDFTVWSDDVVFGDDNTIYPVFATPATWIGWFAVFNTDIAQPTDFETNSFYVNDRWQLNDKWSFNLGVRYDENDGKNSAGVTVAKDDKISPRVGASYDVHGDGDLVVNASYGTYVAAIANSGNIADSTSSGGAIGLFLSQYLGPTVNTNCQPSGAGCVTTDQALETLWDWYFSNGGTRDLGGNLAAIPGLFYTDIPGATSTVPDTVKSPSADELTVGFTKRLGSKGLFRADLVVREWEDFYSNKTTLETGQVDTAAGPQDLTFVGNFGNDVLEREYMGLHTQFRYRFTDRFSISGNYTLSETEGNINGETGPSGPVPSSPQNYPEYSDPSWAFPVGKLRTDQTHKLRVWGIYDLFRTEHHQLSVSWLENFFSGEPYGANGGYERVGPSGPIIPNPGYAAPPGSFDYWFTDRDAFETDDVHRSDVSLNYSFIWNAFGRQMEVFLQPEVLNVFNEDAVVDVNEGIEDFSNGGDCPNGAGGECEFFNPFTTTPVEGVHWAKGPRFGEPVNQFDFQTPRTFRFSVGFRF